MAVTLALVTGVVAIYQRIALQEILRPLVRHFGSRHALPPDQVSSPVGLRLKLTVSFVGFGSWAWGFLWLFEQAPPGGAARFAFGIGIVLAAGLALFAVRDVVARCVPWRSAQGDVQGATRPAGPPWGEADELGRLAVIFEGLRRSLRDRLRFD